jgi:CRISPR-associated protein Csx1
VAYYLTESPHSRILLVATWGNPANWRDLPYVFPGEPGSGEYCTTLIPLLLSQRENIAENKVDVVIVVLESLVDKAKIKVSSKCSECYDQLVEYIDKASEALTYSELSAGIELFIKEFVKCLLDKYKVDVSVEPRVVVAPAVGSPGGNWVFSGEARDYELKVLMEIGELCLENPYSEIIADISHGINFMPALTIRLIPRLASIALIAHEDLERIRIRVYNSDPAPTSEAPKRELFLNEIEDREIRHINLPLIQLSRARLSSRVVSESRRFSEKVGRINREISEVLNVLKYIYTSIYFPLPLLLYSAVCSSNCSKLNDKWRIIKEEILSSPIIDRRGKQPEVIRPVTIDPDSIYVYYLARALCKRLGDHGEDEPTIQRLMTRELKLYERISVISHTIINQELSSVKWSIKRISEEKPFVYNCLKGQWRLLCELEEFLGRDKCRNVEKPEPDKRILIAHAGLQNNLVKVLVGCVSDEHLKLKYREDFDVEKIVESLRP